VVSTSPLLLVNFIPYNSTASIIKFSLIFRSRVTPFFSYYNILVNVLRFTATFHKNYTIDIDENTTKVYIVMCLLIRIQLSRE
jgi:hypothetical protein